MVIFIFEIKTDIITAKVNLVTQMHIYEGKEELNLLNC